MDHTVLLKILLVEDSPTQAMITKKQLSDSGKYEIKHAITLKDAIHLLNTETFNIILLDLTLPDSSGLETVRRIQENHNNIPLIVLSSNEDKNVAIESLKNGVQDFLVKEKYDWYLLDRCIQYAIERKRIELDLKNSRENLEKAHQQLQEKQAMLLQSEKMASIGQLAAGIAHEINNPIGFIKSNLNSLNKYFETLKQIISYDEELIKVIRQKNTKEIMNIILTVEALRKDEDISFILEDTHQLMKESIEGVDRVKDIVQNLKSFARIDEAEIKDIDLNQAIENTLKILANELKYKCKIKTEFQNLPLFRCYPGQFSQVFMNLFINAGHAITDNGEILVTTIKDDNNIIIRVSDTGTGIAKENIPKIFDPFFTTKPVGKGTGLGLSIVYGIIHKHNGIIEVESEVGKGTTFIITLPIG